MSEIDHTEEWRDVVGYEGWYSVSSSGRIRRNQKGGGAVVGRILHNTKSSNGYLMLRLYKHGRQTGFTVHSLVAAAFIGPRAMGYEVNHKNGIKTDNRVENLEILAQRDNALHAIHVLKVRRVRGVQHPRSKLTEAQVIELRESWAGGESCAALGRKYGISGRQAQGVAKREFWRHIA